MTLELVRGVGECAYKLEKWTQGEGEGEQVFMAEERVVTDLEEAVDCFTEAIRGKACL
jgi:hypothetical protein